MTDEELMQQALEAMEYADACLKKQLTAKTKHEYAQDLLMTAGTALRERLAQPQLQPCAGRNCGSTNPNLHSAECFEDYDKATGADSNRTWTQAHWTEYEHSIAAAEREAIAQSLDKQADLAPDEIDRQWAQEMAAAVRARGEKT